MYRRWSRFLVVFLAILTSCQAHPDSPEAVELLDGLGGCLSLAYNEEEQLSDLSIVSRSGDGVAIVDALAHLKREQCVEMAQACRAALAEVVPAPAETFHQLAALGIITNPYSGGDDARIRTLSIAMSSPEEGRFPFLTLEMLPLRAVTKANVLASPAFRLDAASVERIEAFARAIPQP